MRTVGVLTAQLRLYSSGDRASADSLFSEVFPRLREIAKRTLANPRFARSAEPCELINETWLTRLERGGWQIESREHFFALAGLAMEQVLTDMARRRLAQRRGAGAFHISLEDVTCGGHLASAEAEQVLAIVVLMEQLDKADPATAMVVRGRYLMGLEFQEIVKGTGLSLKQVRHRWDKGRIWLATRLAPLHPEVKKRSPGRG
jgi:RNA polymerase sigma factor (TIGR02999 family)